MKSTKRQNRCSNKLVVVRDGAPFKRGILLFDDYNYKLINHEILPSIDELIEAEGDSESSEFEKDLSLEAEGEQDEEYLRLQSEKRKFDQKEKERLKK